MAKRSDSGTSRTGVARLGRIETRQRNPKWKSPPLYIDMDECINCDTCIRYCPTPFGAIFNYGIDVIILPELCSGCNKCIDPCPVDCIYELPVSDWEPSTDDWWTEPLSSNDPYI